MLRLALVSLLCALGATSAHADPPIEPATFPGCEVVALDGKDVCVYRDLEDYKLVLLADVELQERRAAAPLLEAQVLDLRTAVAALERANAAELEARHAFEERANELTERLKATNLAYEQERVKPRLGSLTGWIVAGALGVVAGVVLGASL